MGINPKVFRNMTPQQLQRYRQRVIGLHRGLALAHCIGMSGVLLTLVGLLAYHLATK